MPEETLNFLTKDLTPVAAAKPPQPQMNEIVAFMVSDAPSQNIHVVTQPCTLIGWDWTLETASFSGYLEILPGSENTKSINVFELVRLPAKIPSNAIVHAIKFGRTRPSMMLVQHDGIIGYINKQTGQATYGQGVTGMVAPLPPNYNKNPNNVLSSLRSLEVDSIPLAAM